MNGACPGKIYFPGSVSGFRNKNLRLNLRMLQVFAEKVLTIWPAKGQDSGILKKVR
jgi:hypothetical protein